MSSRPPTRHRPSRRGEGEPAAGLSRAEAGGAVGWDWWRVLALLGVPLLLYLPVLHAGFVWDDTILVTQNATLRAPDGLWRIWAGSQGFHDFYPLTWSLFWCEWKLWGAHAGAYHAVSLALHLASVLVLWRLLERMRLPGAWWAALLFAIHPVNVSSVAWVSETKNTLSFVFFGLAAWAWVGWMQHGRGGAWWMSLAAFAAALLCKTSGVFIAVAFAAGLVVAGRGREWKACVPFFLLAAGAGVTSIMTQRVRAIGDMPLPVESLAQKVAAAGANVVFYASKAFMPVGLTSIYPRQSIDATLPQAWLPLAGVVAVGAAVAWGARRDRRLLPLAWGMGWFVLLLLPVLGLVPMSFHLFARVADCWQYLALPGALAGAVASFCLVCPAGVVRVGVGLVVASLMAALTWIQVPAWQDGFSLWSQNVRAQPASWCGHNSLGVELEGRGREAEAVQEYRAAVAILPDYPLAQTNLAHLLRHQGRVDEALALHREVWRLHPTDAKAANEVAWVLATTRRDHLRDPRGAVELAETACRLSGEPPDPNFLDTLAAALAAEGRFGDATRVGSRALDLARTLGASDLEDLVRQHLEAFGQGRPWTED